MSPRPVPRGPQKAKTKTDHAFEFFSLAISGTKPTAEHIRALIEERVKEGEHLDFKSGDEFMDEKKMGKPGEPTTFVSKVRNFVAGFANSDGGVLVIGVAEAKVPGTDKIDEHGVRPIDGIGLTADEAWFVEIAGAVLDSIQRGAFFPIPGWMCPRCEYRKACRSAS